MQFPIDAPWAKLRPREAPREWHPLVDHAHDVAAAMEAVLSLPSFAGRLARLADLSSLDDGCRARLVVLAFLHDLGKSNHGFQNRALPFAAGLARAGHIAEAPIVLHDEALWEAGGLSRLDTWFGEDFHRCLEVFASVLAHHGAPPAEIVRREAAQRHLPLWAPARRVPSADVAALVAEAERCWPQAFAPGAPLPKAPAFWHHYLGLLQLADWLGSDESEDAFPFAEPGDGPRAGFARARARRLLRDLGLDVERFRPADAPPADFSAVSDFAPTAIQRLAGEAPGPVVVMESETGSGKTEGALYRFARLFMTGRVDGLYLALPTRVAATRMFERVREARDRLFPDPDRRPVVVRALPGDAGADEAGVRPLPDFTAEWSDAPDAAERRRRWAAERPKRFLAAPIAVGTIDQALLGAVRSPHAQMRSSLLSRSLLVVDEVHASDPYMTALLANLLAQHRAAGGEALLLSATLGAAARTALLQAGLPRRRRQAEPGFDEAVALPYPSVSTLSAGRIETQGAQSRGREKRVRLRPQALGDEPDKVARLALDAARAGARVLVMRNTVGDAVATRRALEALAPGDGVQFGLEGRPTLHHGRFARADRRRLDAAVEAAFGKSAPRAGGLVLVGTQTLEISLDIDADLVVTDLAPMDVLLQRLGRLHRHERARPPGFEAPCVHVLVPAGFDEALAAQRRGSGGPHGFGSVYRDLLVLEATRRLVLAEPEWSIPAANRRLVEAATHPDRIDDLASDLASLDPFWQTVHMARQGRDSAAQGSARSVSIEWDRPMTEFSLAEDAATRLGGREAEIVFDPPLPGPFGDPVARLVVPSHLNPAGAFEPVEIRPGAEGFTFTLADRAFVYDSYGLRAERPV
ncbi:CRISPR-associated helicase/endonuclease Cas3 [Aurantimonas sp. Leaf443]|uniref:CRISPR-associated helicase/endonuclease Cas3 n=1 Tax=Aurantimonas sp. Leaf443 TaxID=1736378 RepID=UPI0006F8745B|nr:CRISPR-associated helicase/endonuclease Cas3 [Aurantimonas sp. Leaf443]KQT88481.1 hypothetical protein ASG48_03475 [Aurantimonas sp. Leaf443]